MDVEFPLIFYFGKRLDKHLKDSADLSQRDVDFYASLLNTEVNLLFKYSKIKTRKIINSSNWLVCYRVGCVAALCEAAS